MPVNECDTRRTGHKSPWPQISELQWRKILISYSTTIPLLERNISDTVIWLGFFAGPDNVKGDVFLISIHNYIISKATDSSNSKTF